MRIHANQPWRGAVFAVVLAFGVIEPTVFSASAADEGRFGVVAPAPNPSIGPTGGPGGRIELAQASGGTTSIAKTTSTKKSSSKIVARKAALLGDRSKTTFRLELSGGVSAEVFTLANPYRVIIDLPDVVFELPKDVGEKGRGLVSAFRFGLFAARKARVVLDTVQPVQIAKAEMRKTTGDGVVLELVLAQSDRKSFGAGTGASRSGPKVRRSDGGQRRGSKKADSAKPVVVIDAGHGGIDPGASGSGSAREKTIVLAVAKRLQKKLIKSGRYKVLLTRKSDVFVSLDRRLEKSAGWEADVFVSLHADSIADLRYAQSISGATVYTLSSRASDDEARLIAEKENSVDALAGVDNSQSDKAVEVRNILIDLLKRETANFSTDLSNALVDRFKGALRLSRKPRKSADFKVLRQTRTPSVLIELGYMTNKRDVEAMGQAQWQTKAAGAIAASIDTYFARRSRQAR